MSDEQIPVQVPKDAMKFVKYFLALTLILYPMSSIWIFFFIFEQANWERNAIMADETSAWTLTAVTVWTWWTVFWVIFSDLFAILYFYLLIWCEIPVSREKPKIRRPLLILAGLAYCFAIYGLASRYLRGSIASFVFPFVCATLTLIKYLMQQIEEEKDEMKSDETLRLSVKVSLVK